MILTLLSVCSKLFTVCVRRFLKYIRFVFSGNYILKKSDIENLIFILIPWTVIIPFRKKKKKIGRGVSPH